MQAILGLHALRACYAPRFAPDESIVKRAPINTAIGVGSRFREVPNCLLILWGCIRLACISLFQTVFKLFTLMVETAQIGIFGN